MSELRFDPAQHAYFLGDEQLPSVTTVLGRFYNGPRASPERLHEAGARGSVIHHLTELDDAPEPPDGFPPLNRKSQHFGPRAAWQAWKSFWGFRPEHMEIRMASETMRVAGTCDRIGIVQNNPFEAGSNVPCIVDIKTGRIPAFCQAQLAAYRAMACQNGVRVGNMPVMSNALIVAVRILDDGSWEDVWYHGDYPDDLWDAALTVWRHMEETK